MDGWIIYRISGRFQWHVVSNLHIVESMPLSVSHVGLREFELHDQSLRRAYYQEYW
jgi:hypothetical protein